MSRTTDLLNAARTATGFGDFGAESFQEGLERLVHAADTEARFTVMGAAAFDAQIIGHLSNRLQVEHWFQRHPDMATQQIVAPVIGLGLPRTGSTALACLLAEDPAVRSLRNWEAMIPCPPPSPQTDGDDPRIAQAEAAMERRNQLFPRARQMLPSTATSPTECQTFMAMDFKSQLFQAFAHVPSYIRWLNDEADLVPTYRYVERVLKLLQWRYPGARWRLKNPSHSLFISALNTVFPDARFVMTHRNVAKVVPSVADLYLEYSSAFSNTVDTAWLGQVTTEFCALGMERMIDFRDAGHDHRFFDISFVPFQQDPFPILDQFYSWLGEELTPIAEQRMRAWRSDNARDKHGAHTYDLATFGLTEAALADRFRFYSDRFGV